MPNFLVFGSGGQLGTELVTQLEHRGESVLGVDREQCDITSPSAVRRVVAQAKPQVVFNAAAFSDVDQAESVRRLAVSVNGIGAGIVAAAAREARAVNVFFSSHLVFGADHHEPIDESRQPNPLNNFGHSKWWGEQLVSQNCPRSFIVRTGGMYSRFGTNVIRQLTQIALAGKKTITMVEDERVAPTPAYLVAQTAIELATEETVYGLYHASTSGSCSWFEFVSTFVDKLELDVEVQPVTAERWGAPARRPAYSVLDNLMLRTLDRDCFPDWRVALDAFLDTNGEQIIWDLA